MIARGPGDAMRRGDRLYTLDGLRGIAAILVLLSHLEPAVRLAPGGYLAVDFFFALSGVVIAENYGARLRAGLRWSGFMRTRLIRLYPMFAVGLALGLARAVAQRLLHQPGALPPVEIGGAFLLGLLMLPSVAAIPPIYPLIGPGWSLLFELVANAGYARFAVRWRVTALLALCAAAALGLALVARDGQGLGRGGSWGELHIGLLRVAYSFTLGVALYEGVLHRREPRPTLLCLVPIAATVALMTLDVDARHRGFVDWLSITLALPALVWLGSRWNAPPGLRRAFEWLGDISYPLYTTHYALIFVATFGARRFGIGPALWVPALVVALLAIAHGLARHVDRPARRWLDRHVAGGPPRRPGQRPTAV